MLISREYKSDSLDSNKVIPGEGRVRRAEMKICSFKKYKVVPSCFVCPCLLSLKKILVNVIFYMQMIQEYFVFYRFYKK